MQLRKLKLSDAPLMLEWMHNKEVVKDLQSDFVHMTIKDCEKFIKKCRNDSENLHMAIADESDIYMGTVSLKHIDQEKKEAEFAITIRACAMGQGYSIYAMKEMLKLGIEEIGLNKIYWCVSRNNKRALRFYDKNGYKRIVVDDLGEACMKWYTKEQFNAYIWYQYKKDDF